MVELIIRDKKTKIYPLNLDNLFLVREEEIQKFREERKENFLNRYASDVEQKLIEIEEVETDDFELVSYTRQELSLPPMHKKEREKFLKAQKEEKKKQALEDKRKRDLEEIYKKIENAKMKKVDFETKRERGETEEMYKYRLKFIKDNKLAATTADIMSKIARNEKFYKMKY